MLPCRLQVRATRALKRRSALGAPIPHSVKGRFEAHRASGGFLIVAPPVDSEVRQVSIPATIDVTGNWPAGLVPEPHLCRLSSQKVASNRRERKVCSCNDIASRFRQGLRLGTQSAVARPVRAKRVGDGRLGGSQAGSADGLPEARAT